MMVEIINGHGGTAPATPPADAITITLRVWWAKDGGTVLSIETTPTQVFTDVIVDACLRAVRHFNRIVLGQTISQQQTQVAALQRTMADMKWPRG